VPEVQSQRLSIEMVPAGYSLEVDKHSGFFALRTLQGLGPLENV
jgi:hypothetical protein